MRQRGIAIFAVIFLLVLFATIGAFMARTSGVQNMSTALSARTMQAWFAARTGLEWGIRQATTSQASHDSICDSGGTINTAFTLSDGAANGYQVNLVCDDSGGYQEAGVNFEVDLITVNASRGNPGDLSFVTRSLQAVITTGRALPP
jgi:MSHA biogenesis protein MshP